MKKIYKYNLLFLIVGILAQSNLYCQNSDNYVKNNIVEYNYKDTSVLLKAISEEKLDSCNFFFVGECHEMYFNDSIKLSIFKSLYYNAGVRIILEELPWSYIYFVQKYIENGDESVIKEIGMKYQSPDYFLSRYVPYRNFYIELPDSCKFELVGVNFDQCSWFTIYFLYDIFKGKQIPNEISDVVNQIKSFYNSENLPGKSEVKAFVTLINESMTKYDFIYKQLLLENYSKAKNVIAALDMAIKYPDNDYKKKRNPEREQFMFENVMKIVEQHPHEKYFGQFGYIHISKQRGNWIYTKNWESMVSMISNEKIDSLKTLSMKILYVVKKSDYHIINNKFLTKEQRKLFDMKFEKLSILDINKNGSPFREYGYFIDFLIIDNESGKHYY